MINLPQKVTIVGSGTQGSMLAYRSAIYGREVCIFDVSAEATSRAMEKIKGWFREYSVDGKVTVANDLKTALKDADIIIENVPEILELKQKVWTEIDSLAPAKALLTTNSSSLKASDIGINVRRKDKTFNVNFMTPTKDDMVEVMWNEHTSEETKASALAFLREQKNVPVITAKEIKGFSLNRVWRAIKKESLKLWAGGYTTPENLDRAWMLEWGTPYGPFGLMDKVGLDIIKQIEISYYNESGNPDDLPPDELDALISKGFLGEKTGKGFYEYPDPSYTKPDFLKGE